MKRSIICGLVLSVVAFNSFAANTADFKAQRDFTSAICEISDSPSSNNQDVNILIKSDGTTNDNKAGNYTIRSNSNTATVTATVSTVSGLPSNIVSQNLNPSAQISSFNALAVDKASFIINDAEQSLSAAKSTGERLTMANGSATVKIQPKIYADATEFPRGKADIEGTLTVVCP